MKKESKSAYSIMLPAPMFSYDPWPHEVIDGYYDQVQTDSAVREILTKVKTERSEFVTKTSGDVFISARNLYTSDKFPETRKLLQSRNPSYLLKHFPNHRDYDSLEVYGEVILCLKESEHPIHDEVEDKVLSAVTYLYPETGDGTLLYDRDKKFVKQIEWKPNRTMVFAAETGTTWHSYKSTSGIRLTLNTFLLR